jgi:hypothetical protein
MVYRIRFRRDGQQSESEVVVEANTPTEAMVKFRHVCGAAHDGNNQGRITSICSETSCQPEPADSW